MHINKDHSFPQLIDPPCFLHAIHFNLIKTACSLCGGAISLLFVTCVVFIGYYFWQCVFSHYHELRELALEQTREDKKMLVAEEVPPTYEEVVVIKK